MPRKDLPVRNRGSPYPASAARWYHRGSVGSPELTLGTGPAVKLSRRAFLHLASGAAALPAVSRLAGAQAYPVRPVTVIEPFGVSSVPDITIRIMAPRLSELLGQPVIVENVVDAGGQIDASRVARGAPDGYHLLIGTSSSQAFSQTLFKKPLYDATADFTPIILSAEQPMMLVTSEALPVENLQDFIAYVRKNQSRMKYGSLAGTGSVNHITCALSNQAIATRTTLIDLNQYGQ